MDLIIKGKNLELNDTAEEYINRKIGKLAKYLDGMLAEATVEISVESTRATDQSHVAQVTMVANGTVLRAEERGPDLRSAVDAVASVMQRQVANFKQRMTGKSRAQAAHVIGTEPLSPEEETALIEAAPPPRIVRIKRFALKPMPPEEAAQQMDLLGHNFYVFLNEDSCEVNVIYRRRDGNYGLIEPEAS